jgi:hypothetical protein
VPRATPRLLYAWAAVALAFAGGFALGGDNDGLAQGSSSVVRPLVSPLAEPAQVPRRPDVVMIVMDEFPVDALLGPNGKIDPVRYPNFAALAATGTWFKNASTVYDSTTRAIPAVLDGRLPRKRESPDFRGHPRSVYDLFGRRGYRILSSEEATRVCPPRYCRGARPGRPAILRNLQSGRRERLERFISSFTSGRRPTFGLKHILLPHGPYLFLPGGKQTRRGFKDPVPGMNSPPGFGERFLTAHNQQRLLLQIAFVDHELGRLFQAMQRRGTLDSSMIVVTADHGFAFDVGVKDRRTVTRRNIDEIAPVPLFVKAPGQRRGRTSSTFARTIDIVPTMADVLNVRMPYRAEGRSAFSASIRRRRFVRMLNRNLNGSSIRISARSVAARRRANVRRKNALFGFGDFRSIYTGIGPNRRLIGRSTSELAPAPLGRVRATITSARDLRSYNPSSLIQPTQVGGPIRGGRRGQRRDIAVAVNGRVEAVGRTFYLRGSRREGYGVMIPPESLREGRNLVEVFEVGRGGSLRLIART